MMVRGRWLDFDLGHDHVHIGIGSHPSSYPMGIRIEFPKGKLAGEWGRPLTSVAEVKNV